jgi:hypothetical protein
VNGAEPAQRESAEAFALGERCHSNDRDHLCLALRFVTYEDPEGQAAESDHEVSDTIRGVNEIWRECGIEFQVDDFRPVNPAQFALHYRTANYSELDQIRKVFRSRDALLVVVTGPWDRAGSLGNTHANAWTNLPGEALYGSILEKGVGKAPNLLAHELGHYLSLDHVEEAGDVMSPILYPRSRELTRGQCRSARWAIFNYWLPMMR